MKKPTARRQMLAFALLALFVYLAPALSAQEQPPWIFGMHDPGGEGDMEARGKRGWIVFTEEIGHNRYDWGSRDYRPWTDDGHDVIVRLNNGYEPNGTLPQEAYYEDFAIRAGNWVQNSHGANIWIIGNEPNLQREWPNGQPITVARYVQAYRLARNQIHSRPGHENDLVVPAPSGTYGPPLPEYGIEGFLDYWVNILNQLGADEVDALALHAYTHGSDPNLVFSDEEMASYPGIYYHFRVYKNYMNAIPSSMRQKPVWITETDQARTVSGYNWDNVWGTRDWMSNIHQEITTWNGDATRQPIRGVVPFRWEEAWEDGKCYCIPCVYHAVEGWKSALNTDYRWRRGSPRTQYERTYWVVDASATSTQWNQVAQDAFATKTTVGASYDDAGIGDLNVRNVVAWGWPGNRQDLVDWYQQHYGGVTVWFRNLPGEAYYSYGPYYTSAPGSGRGLPREQYHREYWLVPQNASLTQYLGVVDAAYPSRRTVGFSYDDSGIGELNQRHVVLWGYTWQHPSGLGPWYGQYYTGATIQFAGYYP